MDACGNAVLAAPIGTPADAAAKLEVAVEWLARFHDLDKHEPEMRAIIEVARFLGAAPLPATPAP
jgi:hypothetical protein